MVVYRDDPEHIVGVPLRGELLKAGAGRQQLICPPPSVTLSVPDTRCSRPFAGKTSARRGTEFAIIGRRRVRRNAGVRSLNDVLTAIVGDLPSDELELDPEVVAREDGSWLVDGGASSSG